MLFHDSQYTPVVFQISFLSIWQVLDPFQWLMIDSESIQCTLIANIKEVSVHGHHLSYRYRNVGVQMIVNKTPQAWQWILMDSQVHELDFEPGYMRRRVRFLVCPPIF